LAPRKSQQTGPTQNDDREAARKEETGTPNANGFDGDVCFVAGRTALSEKTSKDIHELLHDTKQQ